MRFSHDILDRKLQSSYIVNVGLTTTSSCLRECRHTPWGAVRGRIVSKSREHSAIAR